MIDLFQRGLSPVEGCNTGGRVSLVKVDMSRKKRITQRYDETEPSMAMLLREGKVICPLPEVLPADWANDI